MLREKLDKEEVNETETVSMTINEVEREKERLMMRDARFKGRRCLEVAIKHIAMKDGTQKKQIEIYDYTNKKHLGIFDVEENTQINTDRVAGIPEAKSCYSDNFFIVKVKEPSD